MADISDLSSLHDIDAAYPADPGCLRAINAELAGRPESQKAKVDWKVSNPSQYMAEWRRNAPEVTAKAGGQ
jgi:hypothetical protein